LININRTASQTIFDSRKTVKADAAQRVFDTDGKGITFAVIDNGIDATHVGFLDKDNASVKRSEANGMPLGLSDLRTSSRVRATYDFSSLRELLSDAADEPHRALMTLESRKQFSSKTEKVHKDVYSLAERAGEGRGLDWSIAAPLIEIAHNENYVIPADDHGTHVAGILAARVDEPEDFDRPLVGVCPKMTIYDLRVFAADGNGDEFSILAALEFIGWLNRDRENPVIHGVNMSLALRHDVDSFGCGRTPVCEACNQLVGSGVVVVAAAGNMGFDGLTKQSLGNGYRTVSITDPGNAEDVITVGSTHRRDPHAYGVSYFSSRGPTGDGRRKPDILAPGEKITSTIRGNRSQRLDGTSMAAPHVAGAAALLMARYPELIGQPRKIKKILMETATDLGREPGFQGAGLLDIFRALQSV
jgi:subtilisin family serine protease